jgi:hypothetical protein
MNPDFINVNGRKAVIELFGRNWHTLDEKRTRQEAFAQYGFECLILWDWELYRPDRLMRKLNIFCTKGAKDENC